MTASKDIQGRIRDLEREILALRREVSGASEPLPEAPFDALEVLAGGQGCLVPLAPVREVAGMLWPQPLPDAPDWVLGQFRYGSEVVPLVDLPRRLGAAATPLDPSRAVVILGAPKWLALAVDAVHGIATVDPERLSPPSAGIPQAPFLLGVLPRGDGTSYHLLSIERLGRDFALDDGE